MKVKRVIEILEANGWRFERFGKGSHVVYKNTTTGMTLAVSGKGNDDLDPGLLAAFRRETGIEEIR